MSGKVMIMKNFKASLLLLRSLARPMRPCSNDVGQIFGIFDLLPLSESKVYRSRNLPSLR